MLIVLQEAVGSASSQVIGRLSQQISRLFCGCSCQSRVGPYVVEDEDSEEELDEDEVAAELDGMELRHIEEQIKTVEHQIATDLKLNIMDPRNLKKRKLAKLQRRLEYRRHLAEEAVKQRKAKKRRIQLEEELVIATETLEKAKLRITLVGQLQERIQLAEKAIQAGGQVRELVYIFTTLNLFHIECNCCK